jgi:lipopolysaccharide biosynthesis glycosyltransferase
LQDFSDIRNELAKVPDIAAALVGDYKPSTAYLLMAWALCRGYKDVFLLLPDFNPRQPQKFRLLEAKKTATQNLKGRSQAAADLCFLKMLRASFPEAKIIDGLQTQIGLGSDSTVLTVKQQNRLEPTPKLAHNALVQQQYSSTRKNTSTGQVEKCAYVTFCDSESYFFGCRALARSLAAHSKIPLLVMVPHGFTIPPVSDLCSNIIILPVPRIRSPHVPKKHQARFENTYTKLNVFGLTFLDKAVFLDADTIVFRNIDNLFDIDGFSAAPDHGLSVSFTEFNSGVFVCKPEKDLFEQLLELAETKGSQDGGDQGFLNVVFPKHANLGQEFNVLKRVARSMPIMYSEDDCAVLHYVGDKPWDILVEDGWDSLDYRWFQMLNETDKIDFLLWTRRRAQKVIADAQRLSQDAIADAQRLSQDAAKRLKSKDLKKQPKPSYQAALKAYNEKNLAMSLAISKAALISEPTSSKNKRLQRRIFLDKRQYVKAIKMQFRLLTNR